MTLLFLGFVILLVWIVKLQDRVKVLEERDEERSATISVLRAQLGEVARPAAAAPPTAEPTPAEWPPRVHAATEAQARPAPPAPTPTPAMPAVPVRAASEMPAPPTTRARPVPPPPTPSRAAAGAHTTAGAGLRGREGDTTAAPPIPPPPPPRAGLPPQPPPPPFDWEALVGVKLFSWVAGIALALAAIFFLGYSIQNGWLQPPVRMAIGIVVGLGLLVACELRVARNYAVTANAMDAAGIVILFSTFFASFALWHLVGPAATFALFVLVTVVAVTLSIRRDSVFVALLGLVGGFSTPALLSTGQDNPIGLFGYLLLLNAGLAWVAYRKRWSALLALSLFFTTLYQWGWAMRFLTAARLPLAGGIFLVFPVLAVLALAILGRERTGENGGGFPGPAGETFRLLTAANAALPLLFAIYLAAVPAYGGHYWMLFGFLLCLDAGLFAIAVWRGPQVLHLLGAASTVIVFLAWLGSNEVPPDPSAGWPAILGFLALFVAFYLAAGLVAARGTWRLAPPATLAVYAAPLLLVAFPILAANEPAFASPVLGFSVLFVLLAMIAAYSIAEQAGMVYLLAAFFALATEAVWSGLHLDPERLLQALVIYGGFGLFYLGVPLVARRFNRSLQPEGLPPVLLLVSIGLLFFLSLGAVASAALWGLALLLGILNLAIFIEGGASRRPLLAAAGSALSWIVLVTWWAGGGLATQAIAAMMIVGGFSLLTLGGHLFVASRAGGDATRNSGTALALVGHLFLFFVAAQPSLSLPPWPMFGVLAVLDLAIAVAALHVRRAETHLGALFLTQAILILWVALANVSPWPLAGALAACATAAMGLAWAYLARRRVEGQALELFDTTAAAAVLLAQVLVIVTAFTQGAPGVLLLAAFHVVLVIALLTLGTLVGTPALALVAVLPAWFATWTWQVQHPEPAFWWQNLELAAPLYIVFLAYPIALGRWAGRRIEPYLAAVLASGAFFHVARLSLIGGGYGDVIGALPIVQAALLGVLLVVLLRLERPGERALGRLALVAGAVLAFVTVAIPLQLEKEWITIGWALEGAALAWLFRRIPHRGLFWSAVALLGVVFVRLALNPEVLVYQPRGSMRIVNWYLYTYLLCAGAMAVASWLFTKTDDRTLPGMPRASQVLPAGATVLLFLLLNIEIADFYSIGPSITFNLSAGLAQDLTYTLGWAVFAVGLLAAGIGLRSHFARMSAIVLLTVTVLKGFLHDMARLGGLYRVFSFVGLAICLSLVAVVLQRFVLQRKGGAAE